MHRTRRPWSRGRAALAVAALLASALTACTSSGHVPPGPQAARPNIVFVLTDDLSTDLIRYMPHVQALQRTGTTMSNYFVVDSLCCPSRSAIFTGQYPHNNGVLSNHGRTGGYDGFNRHGDESKSFAPALHRAGYRTALMGKYLNGYAPDDDPAPGWDEWDAAGNGYPEFDYELNENGLERTYGRMPQDYLTDVISQRAQNFIGSAAADKKPFALELATFAPHAPSVPAPLDQGSFPGLRAPRGPAFGRTPTDAPAWLADHAPLTRANERSIDAAYRRRVESVQAVDRMIGAVEHELAQRGLLDNTYLVFSSDNGFHMGQYRLLPGKQTAFETDIHVPLVMAGPGVPAGGTVSALTSSIDLAPTFTQIAHTQPADAPDGVSMLDLWHGRPAPPTWPRAVLIEHHGGKQPPSDPDRQVVGAGYPPSYEAVRTADALYVEYATGEREYYDLATDPDELHNLAGSAPPARLLALEQALHALVACRGPQSCPAAAARA